MKQHSRVFINNDKMCLRLFRDEAEAQMSKAIVKSERFEKMYKKSPYGFNHPHSHFVGMIAEHAAWVLFTEIEQMLGVDLKIDPAFKDESREKECDIIVGGKRIEVKGIKYGSWLKFGPCISTFQLPKIQKKADIVLWVLYNEKTHEASFVGFNEVDQIESVPTAMTGAEGREKIENYPVMSLLKNLNELQFA